MVSFQAALNNKDTDHSKDLDLTKTSPSSSPRLGPKASPRSPKNSPRSPRISPRLTTAQLPSSISSPRPSAGPLQPSTVSTSPPTSSQPGQPQPSTPSNIRSSNGPGPRSSTAPSFPGLSTSHQPTSGPSPTPSMTSPRPQSKLFSRAFTSPSPPLGQSQRSGGEGSPITYLNVIQITVQTSFLTHFGWIVYLLIPLDSS